MKDYDKYRLNKKLVSAGELSWTLLTLFSKITIGLFFTLTAVIFWQNTSIQVFNQTGIDLSPSISKMFLIVFIAFLIVTINWIFEQWKK